MAGLCALFVISLESPATSAAPPHDHSWRLLFTRAPAAPSNCPDEQYLHNSLAGKLDGHAPFAAEAGRSISIDIHPGSSDVEAVIVARNENGDVTTNETLHVDSWRCDLLGERLVFVLQDIVAPLETSNADGQTLPKTAPSVAPQPRKDASAILGPVEKTPPTHKLPPKVPKLGLSLGLGSTWWNAPEAALSSSIGVELRWPRAGIGIEGQYDFAWTIPKLVNSQAERAGVAILGCLYRPLSSRFFVKGCGMVDIARLSVQADEIHIPTQYAPVVDVGVRMGLGVSIVPSFSFELRADGAYVAHRPAFNIDGAQVWRLAPFTGALRVALSGVIDVF